MKVLSQQAWLSNICEHSVTIRTINTIFAIWAYLLVHKSVCHSFISMTTGKNAAFLRVLRTGSIENELDGAYMASKGAGKFACSYYNHPIINYCWFVFAIWTIRIHHRHTHSYSMTRHSIRWRCVLAVRGATSRRRLPRCPTPIPGYALCAFRKMMLSLRDNIIVISLRRSLIALGMKRPLTHLHVARRHIGESGWRFCIPQEHGERASHRMVVYSYHCRRFDHGIVRAVSL